MIDASPPPWRVIQKSDIIGILYESDNAWRQIFLDGRELGVDFLPAYLGYSTGKWDGDTLVVDTTNFTDKTRFRGSTENLHVIERLTRVDDKRLLYRFTVEDLTTWDRPWTGEYIWPATSKPIYEYACHEGNYALASVLRGARRQEAEEAAAKK